MLLFGMNSDPSRRACVCCVCVCVGKWGYWANVRPSGPVRQVSKCTHHFYYRDGRYGRKNLRRQAGLEEIQHGHLGSLSLWFICNTLGIARGGQVLHQAFVMISWGHMKSFIGWSFICLLHNPCCGLKSWQRRTMSLYMVQSLVGLRPSFHFCWILLEHVIHSTSIHTFIVKKCTGVIYMHSFCNCIHWYNMACLYILRFLLNAIYLESLAQVLLACFAGQGCVSTVGGGDQLQL